MDKGGGQVNDSFHRFSSGEFCLGVVLAIVALAALFAISLWAGGNR